MPVIKKYLPYLGLIAALTLAGCGSSSSSPQQLPDTGGSPAEGINETYQQGVHSSQLDFEGSCFACHATEGSELLKTVAGSGSPEYNLCVSCHSSSSDTIADFPASHDAFIADYAATKNACTQCHDPHAGTKFEQANAADITTQWTQSGHGDVTSFSFNYDGFSDNCLTCHSGPVFAQTVSGVAASDIDTSGGGQVIGCIACHDLTARNSEGAFELGALRQIDSVTFPSGAQASIDAGNNLCLTCHQGRSSTPTVDARIAEGNLSFSNIHYAPAGATLFGSDVKGGYEYEGRNYRGHNAFAVHAGSFFNVPELTTCTGCHMDAGAANHSFDIDIASCTACHTGTSFTTLSGSPSINYNSITQLKEQLRELLELSGVAFADGYPYFSNITAEKQLKAAYNWQFADKDQAGFIHNGIYLRQLLFDSIVDMGSTPASARPISN